VSIILVIPLLATNDLM